MKNVDVTEKMMVFDMDGTLADLYGVKGWLQYLKDKNALPYAVAKPLVNMGSLRIMLRNLKICGWKIIVATWGPKMAEDNFLTEVGYVKKQWLDNYGFPYDKFYCLPYGTTKNWVAKDETGLKIIFDDDSLVRQDWDGIAIDPNAVNMILTCQTLNQHYQ